MAPESNENRSRLSISNNVVRKVKIFHLSGTIIFCMRIVAKNRDMLLFIGAILVKGGNDKVQGFSPSFS